MIKTKFGGEPDHLYYDIDFMNNTESAEETQFPISFQERRPVTILERSEEYYLSVVRFNLMTPNLPVFIPKIKSNQASRDATIYQIRLVSTSGTNIININWEPQNEVVTPPREPVVTQEFSEYYYCNSYSWFLDVINRQIEAVAGFTPTQYCFFQFDSATGNINIITSGEFYPGGTFKIAFNAPLKNLFSTFSLSQKTYSGTKWYELDFITNALPYAPYVSIPLYIMSTFTPPTATWNPISSVVFTTGVLPIIPSLVGQEKFYQTSLPTPGQSDNITAPEITDFQVDLGTADNYYKPSISYVPRGEYRLIDMFGSGGINTIQINIYWKDYYGGMHLMNLSNNCAGNIKMMFVKKSVAK